MSREGCCGLLGALFGHKFVARYSEKVDSPLNGKQSLKDVIGSLSDMYPIPADTASALLFTFAEKSNTYECDVCVRCGKVRRKDSETDAPPVERATYECSNPQ